jgi:hypothetical protein
VLYDVRSSRQIPLRRGREFAQQLHFSPSTDAAAVLLISSIAYLLVIGN